MPVNRNALIRYKTIDKCLQNHYRKWTLENLIDACSDALYEYEGIDKGVSKRTVQADIQVMRSDKLGYNAPIIVLDKKYYSYEDPNYSITNIPLTDQDLGMLTDAVAFMKQFKGFSHFRELDGMVQKLEDHIYSQKTQTKPVIDFEKNDNLKGLEYLDRLYQAIIKKKALYVSYQSFKARQANSFDFHPYLLKEYRNRWFLIGVKEGAKGIFNLALDRIVSIEDSEIWYQEAEEFEAESYFRNAIGVSISPKLKPQEVLLYVNHYHAPYVLTKPLHHSQKEVERDYFGVTISLHVQHNFELEKAILGFGDGIKVLAPQRLKRVIKDRMTNCLDMYNTEVTEKGLAAAAAKLTHKGFSLLNYIYTNRELKLIGNLIHQQLDAEELKKDGMGSQSLLFEQVPKLKNALLNRNIKRLIKVIDPKAFLVKATYFNRAPQQAIYQNWHQGSYLHFKENTEAEGFDFIENTTIARPSDAILKNMFCIKIHLDDTSTKNGIQAIIPGSHNKRLSKEEIDLITANSLSTKPELYAGGILAIKPLLLTSFSDNNPSKRRRVIHLEFASAELAKQLDWKEKTSL